MDLKVNRKHFAKINNIEKFVIKKNGFVWVYRKTGFPKVYISREGIGMIKKRLVNLYCTIHDFKVEIEK